ncbi:MFS transporter [Georgenia halophila]|uniref:MFS transporter n=1 Tax=Georgenia halophila TaxID=620889 RepID=A0ABP8LAT3_9MICO
MNRRLLWSLLLASFALNVLYGAIAGVIVPAQVAEADEAAKETNLSIVMTASSLATMVVHPLAGAWSDRTRGRWGRRSPWIVGGALAAAVAILALDRAESLLAVGLGWLIVQPLLNVVEAPLDAVLADRVPSAARPRASSFYGAGGIVGLAVGAVVAGAMLDGGLPVLPSLAAVLVVAMVTFAATNPDPTAGPVRTSLAWSRAWAARDFRLVFTGRFMLVLGSQLVMGYLLYIVMEFTGVDATEAGGTVAVLVGVHISCLAIGAVTAMRLVRGNRVPAVLGATAVVLLGLLIPLLVPTFEGLVAYAVVSGLGRGAYLTADLALMLDVLPSSGDHGRDLGVLSLATLLPQSLAPALAGVLLAVSENTYAWLFVGAIAVGLGSVPFMAKVSRHRSHVDL